MSWLNTVERLFALVAKAIPLIPGASKPEPTPEASPTTQRTGQAAGAAAHRASRQKFTKAKL